LPRGLLRIGPMRLSASPQRSPVHDCRRESGCSAFLTAFVTVSGTFGVTFHIGFSLSNLL
jgi:hypothetical protein